MNLADLPPVLTVEEYAKALRIGRGAAYEAVRSGQVESTRIGRTVRIPRWALLEQLGLSDPDKREPDLSRAPDSRHEQTNGRYHSPPRI